MGKQSAFLKLVVSAIRALFYIAGFFKPAFFMGIAKHAGDALAELALGKVIPPEDRIYVSLVRGKLTFPN